MREWEPNHRHVSHLISVWPLSQINKSTPELLIATRKFLILHQSGGYHPDKASMWARLLEGNLALAALRISYPTLYYTPMAGFAELLIHFTVVK